MKFPCSRALLLIIPFLGNIVHNAAGCSCIPRPTECSSLFDTDVLVRGTIQNRTEIFDDTFLNRADQLFFGETTTYSYDVNITTVYVNADNLEDLKEDQIIVMRVIANGNLCGVEFEAGSDMILELSNHGHYSTSLCSTNFRIDNGALMRSDYNDCFNLTSALVTTQRTKRDRTRTRRRRRKRTRRSNRVKDASTEDTQKQACPSIQNTTLSCIEIYQPVTCGTNNCTYSNGCEAETYGWDSGNCTAVETLSPAPVPTGGGGTLSPAPVPTGGGTLSPAPVPTGGGGTLSPAPVPTGAEVEREQECPSIQNTTLSCIEIYQPVTCGANNCTYSNGCIAETYGWDSGNCTEFSLDLPVEATSSPIRLRPRRGPP